MLKFSKEYPLCEPHNLLATWFGFGLISPAPGTWGSLATFPFLLPIFYFFGMIGALLFLCAVSLIGFWCTYKFQEETRTHDNSAIVIDEVIGQTIACLPIFYFIGLNPLFLLISFALFRFFDIIKPWPVSWADQKLGGAAGVIIDDVLAGIMAGVVMIGIFYATAN